MQNKNILYQKAFELVDKYSSNDATHRSDHTKRVLQLVEYLVDKEGVRKQVDMECLTLATIFHDLGSSERIKKLKRSDDKFSSPEHSEKSIKIAQKFLKVGGFSGEQITKMNKIIASHGTQSSQDNLEGDLLHDADLLDGLGLIGVLRIFTFGGQINRDILGSLQWTVQKTQNRQFRTKTGQRLGRKRIAKVKQLLEEVGVELENKDF